VSTSRLDRRAGSLIWIVIASFVMTACPGGSAPSAESSPTTSLETPLASPSNETSSSTPAPEDLDAELRVAFDRFYDDPPSFHGMYEYRSDGETYVTYELWVDWPAFRLSFSTTERDGPNAGETLDVLTMATPDGKRFGVRDARADEPYVTRSFGEGVWVLGPMLSFFGRDASPIGCIAGRGVGIETVLGRSAILVRCTHYEEQDTWVDRETGLILRQVMADPSEEPDWLGFVELEFDPGLDPGLFRLDSV
jgi:hypothetical protein